MTHCKIYVAEHKFWSCKVFFFSSSEFRVPRYKGEGGIKFTLVGHKLTENRVSCNEMPDY